MNAQLKKGALEVCVLSQLAKGDKYGYELTEVISQEMTIAVGTLYPILKRLKDDLYVDTYLVESDGGPARKYYHLPDAPMELYYPSSGQRSIAVLTPQQQEHLVQAVLHSRHFSQPLYRAAHW